MTMRPEAISYITTLLLWTGGAVLAALRGWRAYNDRTKAINRLAAALERRAAQCDPEPSKRSSR